MAILERIPIIVIATISSIIEKPPEGEKREVFISITKQPQGVVTVHLMLALLVKH